MNITCMTAKDLIPLCVDDTASRDSVESVYEHIADCEECRKFFNDCQKDKTAAIPTENIVIRAKDSYTALSKRIRRSRNLRVTLICILAALSLIYIIKDIYKITKSSNKGV